MGLYYEDFEVGHVYRTPSRTVTEADIVAFAGLSGDYNPLHTDETYAATTPFGKRVAHGPLGLAILTGLSARTGLFEGTTLAMLGMTWRFVGPIFPGDTVHGEMAVKAKRETSKPGRGIIDRDVRLVNQRGEVVQEGVFTVMVRCRPMPAGNA